MAWLGEQLISCIKHSWICCGPEWASEIQQDQTAAGLQVGENQLPPTMKAHNTTAVPKEGACQVGSVGAGSSNPKPPCDCPHSLREAPQGHCDPKKWPRLGQEQLTGILVCAD